MDPATPVDALHLDPDHEPAAGPPLSEPPPEPAPPSAADEMRAVEHRLAIARNRMIRRLIEVSRRVDHAREKMDVGRIIGGHPFPAVGAAACAGALLALPGKRGSGKRSVPGRLGGLVAALAFALVKDGLGTWLKRSINHAVDSKDHASASPSSAGPFATSALGATPAPITLRGLSPVTT